MESETATATVQGIEPEQLPSLVFLRDTFRLYHSNMWLFLRLIAPAVVFGYIAVYLGQEHIAAIQRQLPRGPEIIYHKSELLEMTLWRYGSWAISWIVYCFAFAGISVAVRDVLRGNPVSVEGSFAPVRQRLARLLGISFLLLAALLFCCFVLMALNIIALLWLVPALRITVSPAANMVVGACIIFVAALIVSRFGLTLPAVVLDDVSVGRSFFVSDEMTTGRWGSLAILLLESIGGSYLVATLPFRIGNLMAGATPVPNWAPWLLNAVAIIGSAMLVPNMFVGFALLYVRMKGPNSREVTRSE